MWLSLYFLTGSALMSLLGEDCPHFLCCPAVILDGPIRESGGSQLTEPGHEEVAHQCAVAKAGPRAAESVDASHPPLSWDGPTRQPARWAVQWPQAS